MAVISDITTGTISVANGSADVTGTGTAWLIQGFKEGDLFVAIGPQLIAVVQSVNSNTSITLSKPWEGPTLTGAPYRLRYAADNERVTAKAQQLIDSLSDGMLGSISDLVPAPNKLIGFDGSGEGTLFDFNTNAQDFMGSVAPWMNSLADLTMAANKLPYGTGANSMGLTDFTAFARALLATGDTAAAYGALGAVPNAQLPDRIKASGGIVTNLNTITESGFYYNSAGATGSPLNASGTLVHIQFDGNHASQYWSTVVSGANQTFVRSKQGGTWLAWSNTTVASGPGWVRLPGGLLVQWGTTLQTTTAGGGVAVALPTAHSNTTYSIIMQQWRNGSYTLIPQIYEQGFPTTSAFYFLVKHTEQQNAPYANATIQVSWVTVGT